MTNNNPLIPDVPFYPGPVYSIENINPNINLDFEENSPFQEGIVSKTFQRLDKSFFQEPQELEDLINKGNLIQNICQSRQI